MIVKVIGECDFFHTAKYLSYGNESIAKLDDAGLEERYQNRVAWMDARGIAADRDWVAVGRIMSANAAQNERLQNSPAYHVAVSWSPDEKVSLERQQEAMDRLLKKMKLDGYQVLGVGHHDTDRDHFHLLVNKVHPETGKVWNDRRDFKKWSKAAHEVEREMGFEVVKGRDRGDEGRAGEVTNREYWEARRTGKEPFGALVKGAVYDDFKAYQKSGDLRALEQKLEAYGLRIEAAAKGYHITDGKEIAKLSAVSPRGVSKTLTEQGYGQDRGGPGAGVGAAGVDGRGGRVLGSGAGADLRGRGTPSGVDGGRGAVLGGAGGPGARELITAERAAAARADAAAGAGRERDGAGGRGDAQAHDRPGDPRGTREDAGRGELGETRGAVGSAGERAEGDRGGIEGRGARGGIDEKGGGRDGTEGERGARDRISNGPDDARDRGAAGAADRIRHTDATVDSVARELEGVRERLALDQAAKDAQGQVLEIDRKISDLRIELRPVVDAEHEFVRAAKGYYADPEAAAGKIAAHTSKHGGAAAEAAFNSNPRMFGEAGEQFANRYHPQVSAAARNLIQRHEAGSLVRSEITAQQRVRDSAAKVAEVNRAQLKQLGRPNLVKAGERIEKLTKSQRAAINQMGLGAVATRALGALAKHRDDMTRVRGGIER